MSRNKRYSLRDATIDLTFSPARVLFKHRGFMEGEIINIDSDESFELSDPTPNTSKQIKNNQCNESQVAQNQSINDPKEVHVGQCPICWDELGKNPLSSTWCGHVFCTECLQQSLKQEKRCPTCRRCINGRTKYHPLFLPQ